MKKPPQLWAWKRPHFAFFVPLGPFTIKREPDRGGWVYLYMGRRLVWDCNADYFRTHFKRVQR